MWDVEVWHDTTMWNEGFENAREPYTVVRVADEKTANLVSAAVDQHNRTVGTPADPGWDRKFEARSNPSNPNRNLPLMSASQAAGFIQGAISKWEGI